MTRTRQQKILRARRVEGAGDISGALAALHAAVDRADENEVRRLLFQINAADEGEPELATGT